MQSFLTAARRRATDAAAAFASPTSSGLLGPDEVQLVAAASKYPATVARMATVSRQWSCAASDLVWEALASSYWLGSLACGSTTAARHVVTTAESALREVGSGKRRFVLFLEQDGQLHLPMASNQSVRLRLAPFRVLLAFGGSRPLCSVSLCSSVSSTVFDQAKASKQPLSVFNIARMHEEDFDEADAVMFWEATAGPGPGLLLDGSRHQCFMWELSERQAPSEAAAASTSSSLAEGPQAPRSCTPPWQTAGAPLLTLCTLSVSRAKERHDGDWRALADVLMPPPPPAANSSAHSATPLPLPLHVVAVQQHVSVDACETHPRQEELRREWFRIEWGQS